MDYRGRKKDGFQDHPISYFKQLKYYLPMSHKGFRPVPTGRCFLLLSIFGLRRLLFALGFSFLMKNSLVVINLPLMAPRSGGVMSFSLECTHPCVGLLFLGVLGHLPILLKEGSILSGKFMSGSRGLVCWGVAWSTDPARDHECIFAYGKTHLYCLDERGSFQKVTKGV